MRRSGIVSHIGMLAVVLAFTVLGSGGTPRLAATGQVTVFATGLNNPRGLRFGRDGDLYVAEGGAGGGNTTDDLCEQVIGPVGPYSGDFTARISRISPAGVRTTVVSGLPSSQTQSIPVPLVSGVADVEFIGTTLYALIAGGGCSHGFANFPNSILRIDATHATWTQVANLSDWSLNHPVANSEEEDFEPDGTWYSMTAVRGDLYAVEPNHGEMVRVSTDGTVSRVIDISASQGHVVPTSVAFRGNFFLGNLDTFPIRPNVSKIWKVTPSGQISEWAGGFSTILGVVIDAQSRIYVLENTANDGPDDLDGPTPGLGRITRVEASGKATVIADGLVFPTAMTFGPDGNLYVSSPGFGPPPSLPEGPGNILKVIVPRD